MTCDRYKTTVRNILVYFFVALITGCDPVCKEDGENVSVVRNELDSSISLEIRFLNDNNEYEYQDIVVPGNETKEVRFPVVYGYLCGTINEGMEAIGYFIEINEADMENYEVCLKENEYVISSSPIEDCNAPVTY